MRFFISSKKFFSECPSRFWKPFGFVLVLFLSLVCLPSESRAEIDLNAFPERGYLAPEFTLMDLEGKRHSLSDYKGKVVLLNVWATWCYPCLVEMPAMESLNKKLNGDEFIMLAVSIDNSGPKPVEKFIRENKFTFKILLSPDGVFQNLYRTISIPMTFIIDKSGIIVSRVMGARMWDSPEAIKVLEDLMK